MAFTRFTYLPNSDSVVVPGVVFPLFYFDTDTGQFTFGYAPPAVPAGDPVMFSVNGEMHVEQCLRLTEQTITTDEPGFGKYYAGEDQKPHFLAGNGTDYDLASGSTTPQVVTVAESGAMFDSVKDACDYVAGLTPGFSNPFLISVAPGIYNEDPFTVPPYTQLTGAGWFYTILRSTDPANHFITLDRACVLRGACVFGPTAAFKAAIHHGLSSLEAPSVIEVSIAAMSHYGILSDPSVSRGTLLLSTIYTLNAGPGASMQRFLHCEGHADVTTQTMIVAGAPNTIGKGFAVQGANSKLTVVNAMFEVAGVTDAMYVDDGATLQAMSCVLTAGQNAVRVGPTGESKFTGMAVKIRNAPGIGFTKDILIESALAEVHFEGMLSLSRVDNTIGAVKFSAGGTNIDVVAGIPVGGEFVIGTSLLVGSGDYPRFTFPPYDIFDFPKLYAQRLVETAAALIPGYGNRAMYNRLIMNPPSDTTERGWAAQCSADVAAGCPANFNCGVPGHPDLMGFEGTAVHEGTGTVKLAAGLMGYVFIGGAGPTAHIEEAISNYGFQPCAGPAGSVIDRAYCYKAKVRPSLGTVGKTFSFASEDGCGNGGIEYDQPEAGWAVKNNGISSGRNENPGTGAVHAETFYRAREAAAPLAEADYGKFYANSADHKPHYMASDGTDYDLALAGDYSRAQMSNCGAWNIMLGSPASPVPLPFGTGSSDGASIVFHGSGIIEVLQAGAYRLSFNLPFESDGTFLQGCSPGACWYWSLNHGATWSPLILTRTLDTVHGDADDNGALTLPPVEQVLAAGTWLRVGGFRGDTGSPVPTNTPAWVNGDVDEGGVYDESWARVEQGSVGAVPVSSSLIAGTTGGFARRYTEVLTTLSGASTTIPISGIAADTKILGVQLRVDDLITFGGGGATWSAAFSGGSLTALALTRLPAKNTKANKMLVGEVASAAVNIVVTPNAGTFSGGNLRAIVYYEQLDAMADAP